ncbi:D-alanyl-D-alanine carboxypeptidase [Sediminibacillus dalangtanensis]|uniref:D-alanyl-D-alanine carboxypeptidase n=1 Tax=Sediminibacillus dalangtanensis TaxID=2729421 RepID=A0ABX7VN71_9BACI|nr:D-alanyl-D-alanine carboxypeptidase family protein [Sediminibacillus dalangtanensis]QTM98026.1 D-alanyl-D-alanine carboxypeptidase [Sediminibacillus dalangtanensis]
MKTFTYTLIFVFLLLIASFIAISFYSGIPDEPEEEKSTKVRYQDSSLHVEEEVLLPDLQLKAEAAILVNADTHQILYEKQINQSLPVASMSKMMTEYLVLEAIDQGTITWDQQIPISDYAYTISNTPGYSSIRLRKDLTYSIEELFHATAIHSANGAAIALAEAVAGNERDFVRRMNDTAKTFGMDDTVFVNSTGLNNQDLGAYRYEDLEHADNAMSVKDVATLGLALLNKHPEILETSSLADDTVSHGSQDSTTYYNTNAMLPEMNTEKISYPGVDGLKTGYTDAAGYCFTGTIKRGNVRYLSVIMGTENENARFLETKKLYEAIPKTEQ